jgi:hypothetical protein
MTTATFGFFDVQDEAAEAPARTGPERRQRQPLFLQDAIVPFGGSTLLLHHWQQEEQSSDASDD